MKESTANKIYDVLLAHCGPFPSYSNRVSFVREFTSINHTNEWRFIGNLGFGGKFWDSKFWGSNRRFYVSCYREDETPERLRIIATVNAELSKIKEESE